MIPYPEPRSDYAVVVRTETPGCTWIVNRANRQALERRPDAMLSAQRRGAFAAGALCALDRISRRGF